MADAGTSEGAGAVFSDDKEKFPSNTEDVSYQAKQDLENSHSSYRNLNRNFKEVDADHNFDRSNNYDCNNNYDSNNNNISKDKNNNNSNNDDDVEYVDHPHRTRYNTAASRKEDVEKSGILLYESFPPVYIVRTDSNNNNNDDNDNNTDSTSPSIANLRNNDLNDYPALNINCESTPLLPQTKTGSSLQEEESLLGRGPLTVMLLYGVYACICIAADEITPGFS